MTSLATKTVNKVDRLLTADALKFLNALNDQFGQTRLALLEKRKERQTALNRGALPHFAVDDRNIRQSEWQVAKAPSDLDDRRVEITGPVERKMMINAFNSGARIFMADLEDSLTPSWQNIIDGHANLMDAVRGDLTYTSPEGKSYALDLNKRLATLVVRPRGWHLEEENMAMSASLFDFGLFFFHNAKELIERGSGPYFYLPKLESYLEARLWNDVFNFAQDYLNIPRGTIRATVLIETIMAAFEMEEILYELKEHAAGLNAGRWDYIFSLIKKTSGISGYLLPDRSQITMAVPFMRAYAKLLVATCHKRGAHAIGGMAAFIPSRKDQAINEIAFARVKEDKEREAGDGFDGTWVAHPDLVTVAKEVFDLVLEARPNQKGKSPSLINLEEETLLDVTIEGGKITRQGVENNIDVALRYIDSWLLGNGAAAINNLMEDAATAEISRAQLWQWLRHLAKMDDGTAVTPYLYSKIKSELVAKLSSPENKIELAGEILDALVLSDVFEDFLTVKAYPYLDNTLV